MSKIESRNPIDGGVIQSEGSCRCFSLDEVLKATYNFDDSLVIGIGGFGKVYKGFVDDIATMVAIKRQNAKSKQGAGEFWMEVKMLSKINHANLVELIGYCHDCDEMILVYEYIARGTLADHLYKLNTTKSNMSVSPLLWEQRLNICIGVARGLDHLHSGTSESFIHRDVKTTNILIDENWVAKISDFGLSKGTTSHSITHISTNVKGTFGYLDPDYYFTQRLTTKTDVYAFGVVLLEVLCGRPPVDRKLDEDKISLVLWAQQYIEKGKLEGIIDPSLIGQVSPRCLKSFVVLANNCLHKSPKSRPTMAEVLGRLELVLLSQQRGRSEGVMTKVFQSMMERWLRERKDNSSSSGQSNDSPQDLKGRQQINHTREPPEEGLVEITEEYTEETSAEEVSKAGRFQPLIAKLMSKIDKEEVVEESDEGYSHMMSKLDELEKKELATESVSGSDEDYSSQHSLDQRRVLSDPQKRAIYDQYGEEGLKGQVPPPPSSGGGPTGFQFNPRSADDIFSEIFGFSGPFGGASSSTGFPRGMFPEEIFGNYRGGGGRGGGDPFGHNVQRKAAAIEMMVPCSLEDLYKGTSKKMVIGKRANDASWRPRVEEILTIEIKPGWKKGTKITFPEKGNAQRGVIPSDLVFIVDEKPHNVFKRDGNDLVITQKISLVEALTGYTAQIRTLDGRNLTVPINAIISPTYEEVVKGEGMPISKEPSKKGNLRIKFNIKFPIRLTSDQKSGMKRLLTS